MPSLFIKYRTLLMLVYMLTHHQGFGMKNGRFHSELIEFLMEDYGKPYVRPNSDPVQVGFRFTPVISILDETRMELQLRGMLAMTWNDDRLVWDQEQHGHIKWTYIPLKEDNKPYIWKPELVLNESLDKDSSSFHMETDYVKLFSNGTIYWYTLAMTTSYCRVNVKHFPFDKQKCVLTFTTWLYQSTEQAFYIIDDIIKNEMYKNYEVSSGLWVWDITDLHAGNNSYYCSTCNNQEQSYITYTVEMSRTEHVWHFLIYLLPCMVLSTMLILIVELTRRYDVDAPNFGLTCILTLFVFLTFLFTQLPATGPPIMGFYIVVLIVEAVSATVYVTFRKAPRSCTKDDHIALADTKRDNKTLTEDTEDEKSKTTVTRMKTGWMGWIDKWIIRWWCFTGINMVFVIIFFPVIGFGK